MNVKVLIFGCVRVLICVECKVYDGVDKGGYINYIIARIYGVSEHLVYARNNWHI